MNIRLLVSFAVMAAGCWPAPAGPAAPIPTPVFSCKAEMDNVFGRTPGTLSLLPEKLLFEAVDREQSREWAYAELRFAEWKGPGKIELKTRERDAKFLGKKKTYTFLFPDGSFPEDRVNWINERIQGARSGTPAPAEAVPPPAAAAAGIQWPVVRKAEHMHSFGSCFGSLVIGPDIINYRPQDSDHDEFRLSYMDIKEVHRKSPFNLRLTTYKSSAKKMWMSQDIEFNFPSEGLGDDVFAYIEEKVKSNQTGGE